MAQDRCKHVVEIVGHAAGQAAHRLHLLGLQQLRLKRILFLLRPLALGDITDTLNCTYDFARSDRAGVMP